MNTPRISIVTPSFNQGQYLEQTICSILDQHYPNLQYIILDGGSTDNSVEIIRKYEKYLTYWASEKDKGQSDAINKGLALCTGDLFNWLNSDDYLEKNALSNVANAYRSHSDKKIFHFGLSHFSESGKKVFEKWNNPVTPSAYFCDPVIKQQSTFYHSSAIRSFGKLNTTLHYCMDYEWWLKAMFLFGPQSVYESKDTIAVFRLHNESKTSADHHRFVNDIANILYSLSIQLKIKEYSELLEKGFSINDTYFFDLKINASQVYLVKRMIEYFLLKWCHWGVSQKEFNYAKAIVEVLPGQIEYLNKDEKKWHEQLLSINKTSWFLFDLKRRLRSFMNYNNH